MASAYLINTRLWPLSAWLATALFLHSTPDTAWQAVQSCLNNRHKRERVQMWVVYFCLLKAMAVESTISPEHHGLPPAQYRRRHGEEVQKYQSLRKRSSKDFYPPAMAFVKSRLHIRRMSGKLNGLVMEIDLTPASDSGAHFSENWECICPDALQVRWELQFIHSLIFIDSLFWKIKKKGLKFKQFQGRYLCIILNSNSMILHSKSLFSWWLLEVPLFNLHIWNSTL